jgi:hypothetical protein
MAFKMQAQKKAKELETSFHKLLKKFEDNMAEVVSAIYNNSPTPNSPQYRFLCKANLQKLQQTMFSNSRKKEGCIFT